MTSPTGLFAVAPWLLLLYLALAILARRCAAGSAAAR